LWNRGEKRFEFTGLVNKVGSEVAVIKNNKIMRHASELRSVVVVGNMPDEEMLGSGFSEDQSMQAT
jgi:hypothetical protein